jgi:hypothetical protein
MTASNALFGNVSFLQPVLSDPAPGMASNETMASMCRGVVPYQHFAGAWGWPTSSCHSILADPAYLRQDYYNDTDEEYETRYERRVDSLVGEWIGAFDNAEHATNLLATTLFATNRAVLTKTVAHTSAYRGRPIYSSEGTSFTKPTMSLASMIAISVLMGLLVIGLSAAVWYALREPTWTHKLDGVSVARLGRVLDEGVLGYEGPVREPAVREQAQMMPGVDALIGVRPLTREILDVESGSEHRRSFSRE